MKEPKILIVDDESGVRTTLSQVIQDEEWIADTCISGEEALKKFRNNNYDIVLLDVLLPGKDGIQILKQMKKIAPSTIVIMISGHSTIEMAVKATQAGAFDFLEKPLALEKVILTIKNALEKSRLIEENIFLKQNSRIKLELVGESPAIRKLKEHIELVSQTDSRVLISGEKGTGKELVARLIHENSTRRENNFVKVNFAAIPEEVVEEELFGYVKGAFSYAISDKKGKFELADGGTLFLESVESVNKKIQGIILRALEDSKITTIGGSAPLNMDVRIITSTNKDLSKLVKRKKFREDLFEFLNLVPIKIPPLRERKQDIPLLSEFFIDHFSDEYGMKRKYFSDNAMRVLVDYPWYGNVRELRNLIERIFILVKKEEIEENEIRKLITPVFPIKSELITEDYDSLNQAVESFKKEFITFVLYKNDYNIDKTSEELRIEPDDLKSKIKKLDIEI